MELEKYAIGDKYPKKGKCKKSVFMNGYHRVGTIPFMSLLDGGLSGESCRDICLDCGKAFKQTWFNAKAQPNKYQSITP